MSVIKIIIENKLYVNYYRHSSYDGCLSLLDRSDSNIVHCLEPRSLHPFSYK